MADRDLECFPPDYATSRQWFRAAARAQGMNLDAHPIGQTGSDGEDLTIEVARLSHGTPQRVLLVSSGLHGVEGPFGAAVQLGWMQQGFGGWQPREGDSLVLVHALNPYGFAWRRRFDEKNIDLNRNFLVEGEEYSGCPPGYEGLDPLINPRAREGPFDALTFRLRAWSVILRRGLARLKAAIAGGQYEYPQGLFFGGHGPSRVKRVVEGVLEGWVGPAGSILHIDFHTGLGHWADYMLLTSEETAPGKVEWLRREFGSDRVEMAQEGTTAYPIRGEIGRWLNWKLRGREMTSVCAEFGTYPPLDVLAALRAENRATHWFPSDANGLQRKRRALLETFVPGDRGWRRTTLRAGISLLNQAVSVQFGPPRSL